MEPRWTIAVWALVMALLRATPVIETHELSALLLGGAQNICILEVIGINEATEPALDKHIPGAKQVSIKSLAEPTTWPLVKVPKLDHFRTVMKQYGITRDTFVVVYDRQGMKSAAMVWWTMSMFGRRDKTKVLNGGFPKWQREQMFTQGGIQPLKDPLLENDALYQYVFDPKMIWTSADVDALQSSLQPFVQVLDVRVRSEFVLANLKSSINMPIDIISRADGALRSAIELKSIFEGYQVKVTNETLTVVVSSNGVESSSAILALSLVGKGNCANLDGGWADYTKWLKDRNAPPLGPPVVPPLQPQGPSAPAAPPASTTPPATTPPAGTPPAATPPTAPPTTTPPAATPPAATPPAATPPAATPPAATPPAATPPAATPPVATRPPATNPPPGPAPTTLTQRPCDPSCSLSCLHSPDLHSCWSSCNCPLSSVLASPQAAGVPGLPSTSSEISRFQEFLQCTEMCAKVCRVSDRLCRDRCAFGFCYQPLETQAQSSSFSLLIAITCSAGLLYYFLSALYRQDEKSLLGKWM